MVYPSFMMIDWVHDNGLANNNAQSKRWIDIILPRKQRDLQTLRYISISSDFKIDCNLKITSHSFKGYIYV